MDKLLEILDDLRPDVDFLNTERLIDDGVLDSFDVLSLVSEINGEFGVAISVAHVTPANFNDAKSMFSLIERLK